MKKIIKLNEQELKSLIYESVKRVLNEEYDGDYNNVWGDEGSSSDIQGESLILNSLIKGNFTTEIDTHSNDYTSGTIIIYPNDQMMYESDVEIFVEYSGNASCSYQPATRMEPEDYNYDDQIEWTDIKVNGISRKGDERWGQVAEIALDKERENIEQHYCEDYETPEPDYDDIRKYRNY